jgi:hypothetical protein
LVLGRYSDLATPPVDAVVADIGAIEGSAGYPYGEYFRPLNFLSTYLALTKMIIPIGRILSPSRFPGVQLA